MDQTNLLEGIVEDQIPAQKELRFVNLLIDTIAYYVLSFLVAIVIGSTDTEILPDEDGSSGSIMLSLFSVLLFILYFGLLEGATNGKTLGKLLTGTRAVKEDGSPITYKDAFLRSLSRLVPFEPLSGFSHRPWHDRWTDTVVIKENRK